MRILSLIGTLGDGSEGHERCVSLLPLGVLDELGDELDNVGHHLILEKMGHLDKAAATGEVHTPVLLCIVLIINLHVADAFEKQRDQPILVLSNQVENLTLLFQTGDFDLCNGRPELDTLRTNLRCIVLCHVSCDLAQASNVGAHELILLPGDLDEALHRCLTNAHVRGAQRLVQYLVHDEISLLLVLEVRSGVRDRMVKRLDCQAARLHLSIILADVVRQG